VERAGSSKMFRLRFPLGLRMAGPGHAPYRSLGVDLARDLKARQATGQFGSFLPARRAYPEGWLALLRRILSPRGSQEAAVSGESARSASPSREALLRAAERAEAYLSGIDDRRVFPGREAIAGLQQFHEPFPESPLSPEEVLDLLDRLASPATVSSAAGRYFGYVIGSALPAATAARWLTAAWNQNTAL